MVKGQGTEPLERLLKRTRKEKGLSIDDVVRGTRLRKMHLKQFETKLPEQLDVYQLGYLRLYARYLELDIHKYIDDYQNRVNPQKQKTSGVTQSFLSFPFMRFWKNIFVAAVIIIIIASGAFLVMKKPLNIYKKEASTQTVTDETPAPSEEIIKKLNPYTYVLTGPIAQLAKVKIVANEATLFTLLDSEKNILAKGSLKAGELLSLPNDIKVETITIQTSIPNVLVAP